MRSRNESMLSITRVLALAALLAIPFAELGAGQERVPRATTQPSGSSASSGGTQSSGTTPVTRSTPRQSSAPSGGNQSSGKTPVTRSTPRQGGKATARDTRRIPPGDYGRSVDRGRGSHYHGWRGYFGFGYRYPYYYHHPYSWGWGWGYWGPSFYGGYWGPGPYRARYVDYDMGALDLNVRPRKTEIYVDGDYIGQARDFDGWPSYLWLDEGSYEITFYHEGYRTVTETHRIRSGLVIELRRRLERGESTPPERTARRAAPLPEAAQPVTDRQAAGAAAPAERGVETGTERDLRLEPGTLQLSVQPVDASVYLDGRLLGSGSEIAGLHAGLLVEPGEHVLEVVRPGYSPRQVDFSVTSGDTVDLEVELTE